MAEKWTVTVEVDDQWSVEAMLEELADRLEKSAVRLVSIQNLDATVGAPAK